MKYVLKLLILSSVLMLSKPIYSNLATDPMEYRQKGLYLLQFSWDHESFDDNGLLEIVYRKKNRFGKEKIFGRESHYFKKNEFLTLELKAGEYELLSVRYHAENLGPGKYYNMNINDRFTIVPDQVTNGGLFFLVTENRSSVRLLKLKIDNTEDVAFYVKSFLKKYDNGGYKDFRASLGYLYPTTVDQMNRLYVEFLVGNKAVYTDKRQEYVFGILGILARVTFDRDGSIIGYQVIPTPTYQEIREVRVLGDSKLLITLGNGLYLYGHENTLVFSRYPEGIDS